MIYLHEIERIINDNKMNDRENFDHSKHALYSYIINRKRVSE